MAYVQTLSAIGLGDADRVGRKAAVLGELMSAGFAVPPGFALTVEAHDRGALTAHVVAEVRAALRVLPYGPVAVRSSGLDEDLSGASYAGQYESVLGVRGLDAVLAAVRTCWESAESERVTAYRGDGPPARMGVLVQAMVPARAAGIAFSRNPVTGDDAETVVSAVRGLGDRLASGEVNAQEWAVRRDGSVSRPDGDAISTVDALAIAGLARQVAAYFEAPQDIEWAFEGETLWLLQARPITALPGVTPVEVDIEVPPGHSTRNPSIDRPWTALERSLFLPVFSGTIRHIFAYTSGVVPSAHAIGGWVYITMPEDTPHAAAARTERIASALAAGVPQHLVRTWHSEWKPQTAQAIARLRAVDLPSLTDRALAAHLRDLVTLFGELHDRYFRLTGAGIAVGGSLGLVCAELFGWSPAQSGRLRGGLRGDHMTATVRLSELARLAAARPTLRRFLSRPDATPEGLGLVDAQFAAAFAEYLCGYAHRTIGFDLTEPTLAEQPAVLLALVRAQLDHPYDFATERSTVDSRIAGALAEARALLADRSDAERERFEQAYAAGADSSPVRDEKVYYAVSLWALVRYAVLEIGRRLVSRGTAGAPDDALHLELTELLDALCSGTDVRTRVTHHRGQYAWAHANPGPPTYGTPPVAAATTGPTLSPAALRTARMAQSSLSLMAGGGPQSGDDELRGLAASAGRYLGPVRVIRSLAEFGKLRHGDVLVCPETTAQWSILFPSVGALVTDRGSLLSHPAIIAREYGVPAVVATGRATTALKDDQLVVVDGTTGVVTLAPASVTGVAA